MSKCDFVLVAAGTGRRFGGQNPKQFEAFDGRPLYLWSLEKFLNWDKAGEVVVVVPPDWVEPLKNSFMLIDNFKKIQVVAGGHSRRDSAFQGLRQLENSSWVMVHDAARPAFTSRLLDGLWLAKESLSLEYAGVVPGLEVTETIKWVEDGTVKETLPREKLRVIQTPQLFRADILKAAYKKFQNETAFDDATLVEKMGCKVAVIVGEYGNLKVTFAEDKERVSGWLGKRHTSV